MPALPEVFSHMPSYPAFRCSGCRIFYANPKVGIPASDVLLPFLYPLFQRLPSLVVPVTSYLVFQFLQTGFCEFYLPITIDFETQLLPFQGRPVPLFFVFTLSFKCLAIHSVRLASILCPLRSLLTKIASRVTQGNYPLRCSQIRT